MKYIIHDSSFVERCEIGDGTIVWHFCHLFNSTIGRYCIIGQNCMIGPDVKIGNYCKIQNNVSLYKGLIVEDDVFIGPSVVFTNVMNPRSFISRKDEFRETIIKTGASIGANATILCGVTIGEYSAIGAGSVVTKDVDPYTLVLGTPAKFKKHISRSWL